MVTVLRFVDGMRLACSGSVEIWIILRRWMMGIYVDCVACYILYLGDARR